MPAGNEPVSDRTMGLAIKENAENFHISVLSVFHPARLFIDAPVVYTMKVSGKSVSVHQVGRYELPVTGVLQQDLTESLHRRTVT